LIIVTGLPSSGKTRRTKELEEHLIGRDKKVRVISENLAIPKAGFRKNECFEDSKKEKIVRSDLKSEALRLLSKDDVTILDAGNYIKGYRYELYCASKSARTTQCTIFCGIKKEKAWEFNARKTAADEIDVTLNNVADNSQIPYTREIFDALCMRYEEPQPNNRWDNPLFTITPDGSIDFTEVYAVLFEKKPPPPNMSTQNPPLSSTNYLFEVDKLTQEITNTVISSRKAGILGPVTIRNDLKVNVPAELNASQLNRLRRQFSQL